jgi:hypothetical protein
MATLAVTLYVKSIATEDNQRDFSGYGAKFSVNSAPGCIFRPVSGYPVFVSF